VVGGHPDDELVHHGVHVEQPAPPFPSAVSTPLLTKIARPPLLDHLLLDELEGPVRLAEQPVGGEEEEDPGGPAVEAGAEGVEPGPVVLHPADGEIQEDVVEGNEDALTDGVGEDGPDLVGDRVLEPGAVPGVGGADDGGLVARELGVELGDDPPDLLPRPVPPGLPLVRDLGLPARPTRVAGRASRRWRSGSGRSPHTPRPSTGRTPRGQLGEHPLERVRARDAVSERKEPAEERFLGRPVLGDRLPRLGPPITAQVAVARRSVSRWGLSAVARCGSGRSSNTAVSGSAGMGIPLMPPV
jgi:hypothetical protein